MKPASDLIDRHDRKYQFVALGQLAKKVDVEVTRPYSWRSRMPGPGPEAEDER
jgi:hypothetical protein